LIFESNLVLLFCPTLTTVTNHGYKPQIKLWKQITLQAAGVLYPPLRYAFGIGVSQ